MITRLYLDNCFRHHDRTFHFDKGLTGIVGPNESGKSLIVEMIRYALFGSKALRGKAEDYRRLHVELDFVVDKTQYTVIRRGSRVELVGIASGTRPVNEAIQRILGYDLTVFDVANACNQGNIEALSDMRPTERKAMVDRTVGLDMLDELIRFCGAEGNALKREAEAMKRTLAEPVEPEKPDCHVPSSELEPVLVEARTQAKRHAELVGMFRSAPPKVTSELSTADAEMRVQQLKALHHEWQQLRGYLSRSVEEPVDPGPCPVGASEEALGGHQDRREQLLNQRRRLNGELARLKPEPHTADELDGFENQHHQADLWEQKQKLLAQGTLSCPECSYSWPVAAVQLEAYAEVPETARPSITRRKIAEFRQLIGNAERIAAIEAELASLELPVDRSEDLARLRAHAAAMEAYRRALQAWTRYHEDLPAIRRRFRELSGNGDQLHAAEQALQLARDAEWWARMAPLENEMQALAGAEARAQQIQERLIISREHERQLAVHAQRLAAFKQLNAEVSAVEAKAGEYFTARERITALKVTLKSHLLPSLNKVASALLAQMTGGERYRIEVDDDFEILVDGQALNTLSGSGKAVANLAIRIALGQILTNRVFSLFMADEVDAAMDEDRAEYTAQALRRLTTMVTQVILVTHKRPETDHAIELKSA